MRKILSAALLGSIGLAAAAFCTPASAAPYVGVAIVAPGVPIAYGYHGRPYGYYHYGYAVLPGVYRGPVFRAYGHYGARCAHGRFWR